MKNLFLENRLNCLRDPKIIIYFYKSLFSIFFFFIWGLLKWFIFLKISAGAGTRLPYFILSTCTNWSYNSQCKTSLVELFFSGSPSLSKSFKSFKSIINEHPIFVVYFAVLLHWCWSCNKKKSDLQTFTLIMVLTFQVNTCKTIDL